MLIVAEVYCTDEDKVDYEVCQNYINIVLKKGGRDFHDVKLFFSVDKAKELQAILKQELKGRK